MVKQIRKRNGIEVDFDVKKIEKAIFKALQATNSDVVVASQLASKVACVLDVMFDKKVPSVEEAQDIAEQVLINNGLGLTAKAFILYRNQKARLRNEKHVIDNYIDLVDNYIKVNDWKVNENSNMGYSLQGLNNYISSHISSNYWLHKIYDEDIAKEHISGRIHIHDLGLLSTYCCGWDLFDLLSQGFRGVKGKIESHPPKHLRSALGQIVNFFYTLQGEAAGAQAFSNFDTLLAPYIRYDGLSRKDVKQQMQEFIFNINVPTRVGFQTPFTNVTMDLQIPEYYKDMPVMIGGEPQQETYKEFQFEMDMVNDVFCEVMMEGDAKGRIFSFPIPTYNITPDFNWENSNLNSLWQMTSKYGIPYFANFINSDMKVDDARSMCCRLRLDNRELVKRGGGLFGSNPMTGSIGVVTLNLPRLAYESQNKKEFFDRIYDSLNIARRSLTIKRKALEEYTESGLYPYCKYYLSKLKKSKSNQYWVNHFNTIGVIGMNEASLNLIDKNIVSGEGKELAKETLLHIREKLGEFQIEDDMLYNLEATPGEGTSYRLAQMDKRQYPDIKTSGISEPYYTNSTQLPVNQTNDIFDALQHQDELQTMYTGGTVLHGFIGEQIYDSDMCKEIVKTIAMNFRLPYFTITPTFSVCPTHGYIAGEHHCCPVMANQSREVSNVTRNL